MLASALLVRPFAPLLYPIDIPGTRVAFVVNVVIDLDQPWRQLARLAGPQTNNDNLVFTLNDLPPSKSSPQARRLPTKEKFIIANFGRFTSSKRIIAWGEKSNLAPISERQCCFIGVYYPKLNQVLGQPVLVVQSLKKCYSEDGEDYVCGVEWQGDQRYTTLYRFGYGWDSHYYWFGFAAMPR